MAADIALIIGNGFSISFNKHHKIEKYDDTQNPTKWPLTFGSEGKPLIESFPEFKSFLNKHCTEKDFFAFEKAADIYKSTERFANYFITTETDNGFEHRVTEEFKRDIIPIECRHFLCLSFSSYSIEAKAVLNKEWPWYRWLEANRSRISAICSYNYDLIIELLLGKINRSYYNEAMDYKFGALPLYKPHGSCDYETTGISIEGMKYPLTSYIDDNDFKIKRLPEQKLLSERIVPYCVIPNQENIYRHFQSMIKQEASFNKKLAVADYCLIIGHSYADVDKPEIDAALSKLKSGAKVVIADPWPSEDLLKKVKELGLESICWKNHFGPLDCDGELLKI